MTDTIRATPTDSRITHDLELTDGTTSVGLILCNSKGIPIQGGNPWSLRQSGSTRTSLQISSGDASYSNYQLPYTPFTQKDWSGGRGNEDFEDDKTRYYDGNVLDTRLGDILLAGKATSVAITAGSPDIEPIAIETATSVVSTGSNKYASSFTATDSVSINSVTVLIGAGCDVTVSIVLDDGGAPSADAEDIIATGTASAVSFPASTAEYGPQIGAVNIGYHEIGSGLQQATTGIRLIETTVSMIGSITAAETYWVVVETELAIGYGTLTGGTVQVYEGSWSEAYANKNLYFKIDSNAKGIVRFFEYKGQLYAATTSDNGLQSRIFMSGYRFTAAAGSTTNIIHLPGGLTLTSNELIGCTLQVIGGKCYTEHPNYRTIISNSTSTITLDRAFLNTPDSTTDVVILGRDKWTEITSTGLTNGITSILVANETVYIAQGENYVIRKMVESNVTGTWTRTFSDEGASKATFLASFPNHVGKDKIWKFNNPSSGPPTASYASPDENRLLNGSFELEGDGDPDYFDDWVETKGNGAIAVETGAGKFRPEDGGAKSIKLTTGADGLVKVSQDIRVIPGHDYTLSFWIKGDGATNKARYHIVDKTNAADIVATTSVPTASTVFYEVTDDFTAPAGCVLVTITLAGSATTGAIAYFDSVKVTAADLDFTTKPKELETEPDATAYDYPIIIGDARSKITGVVGYGDPILPTVFKEDEFGNINSGIYAKYPISELAQVKNAINGTVSIQFGVYLFFNVLDGWERFYQNKLDDIGPNRDEGLPEERRGEVSCVVSYPGGMYVGVNAGVTGYSSVLYWNQTGYHEMYRAPYGSEIRSLTIQTFPGKQVGRLWIGMGDTTAWIPVTMNPRKQSEYHYTSTGSLISAWFNGGFREINKFWKSVQLYGEGLNDNQYVTIEYQTDIDETWHTLPDTFDTSPMQEVLMSDLYNVSGKRWRYRITLTTTESNKSPRIKALTVPSVTRLPNEKAWSITVLADDALVDHQGKQQSMTAKELMDQLTEWADSSLTPYPLTMRSPVSVFDNKKVFIEPPTVQPIEVLNRGEKKLKAICTLMLYEA